MGAKKQERTNRVIWIYHTDGPSERLLHVVISSSLKRALEGYFLGSLAPRGFDNPIYVGNTMTVTNAHGHERSFKAVEPK